jgi:hypothetical protein
MTAEELTLFQNYPVIRFIYVSVFVLFSNVSNLCISVVWQQIFLWECQSGLFNVYLSRIDTAEVLEMRETRHETYINYNIYTSHYTSHSVHLLRMSSL